MTRSLRNQLVTSSPSAQLDAQPQAAAHLTRERVEAAFGEAPRNTGTTTLAVTTAAARPTSPRGIHFTTPTFQSNLISFITEQRWQGYVTGTQGDKFQAIVYDTFDDEEDVEEAEFDRDEVSEVMRGLIQPGAIFFWDIGFQVDPSGQRIRQSIISFPMIPVHTEKQRIQALERAKVRFRELGWRVNKNESSQSENSA
jgi:hypothetical protein